MKKEIYVNELSLNGQFRDMEEFLKKNKSFIALLVWLKNNGWDIYKKSDLYERNITESERMYKLRGMKHTSNPSDRDLILRYKKLLLDLQDSPPFWDIEMKLPEATYTMQGEDISCSSIAKSCESSGLALSFWYEQFENKELQIVKDDVEALCVFSVYSLPYLNEVIYRKNVITAREYIELKYRNTRLDFSKLEDGYDFIGFEKKEIEECIESFDRFIKHESWEALNHDRSLNFKEYSPASKKDDWFYETEYSNKKIYKFRCGNPKRCFGYREQETFYVLRMERDHKISDKG